MAKKKETRSRIAILGMGHELRGDDAAGLAVVRALQQRLPEQDWLLILDTGPSPEAFTGRLREFAPDRVLFIDAAQMDAEPGSVAWLADEEVSGLSASTHTFPVSLVTRYIREEFNCHTALIGIQPARTVFDTPLSAPVEQAVERVVAAFLHAVQSV